MLLPWLRRAKSDDQIADLRVRFMSAIRLKGEWIVKVPRKAVFEILTDFEASPRHFPDAVKSARIVSRGGNSVVVEMTIETAKISLKQNQIM